MGTKKDISELTKGKIIGLLELKNLSHKEIAVRCDVARSTVSKINSKLQLNSSIKTSRKNGGRKKKSTPREDRLIIKTVLQYRAQTIRWISSFLISVYSICLSMKTIRRRLQLHGIKCCNKTKKFLLNEKMIAKRRAWAWKMRNWNPGQLSRVRQLHVSKNFPFNSSFIA